MEDFSVRSISWDQNQNYSNISINDNIRIHHSGRYRYNGFCWMFGGKADILTYIIISIFLLLTPVVIYSVFTQVRRDHVAPVYIINLLISDLIRICCLILALARVKYYLINKIFTEYIYSCGVLASLGSMLGVAVDRYLAIAHPQSSQLRQTIKTSVVTCVLTWIFSIVIVIFYQADLAFFYLISLPLLVYFLFRSIKALSTASSVPTDEKRQIVAFLVVVLLMHLFYTIPYVMIKLIFLQVLTDSEIFNMVCILIQIDLLTDIILYFFFMKSTINRLQACFQPCCCRMDSDDTSRLTA